MRREALGTIAVLLGAALLVAPPGGSAAPLDFLPGSGRAGFYGLSPHGDRDSSKYDEYRDIPRDHPFLDELEIEVENEKKSYYIEFRTEDTLQDDQRYILRMGKYGKYEMEMGWDEIPHVLSRTGRTLYRQESEGVFTLPDETQQALQADPALAQQILALARDTRLALGRDTGTFSFRYTPTPAWDVRVGYEARSDDGQRPISTGFFFGRAQPIETLNPVDYLTHEIASSVQYGTKLGSIRLSYTGSLFENDVDALVWDNPFQAADSPFQGSRGRLDLAPDNQAHTVALDGALNLPMRSRLVGNLSYGWMFQDDDFLPFTINETLQQPLLPATSLDGELNPFVANLRFTSRPHADVGVNAGYRMYDLSNESRMLDFPGYIAGDSQPEPARRNLPYEYTIHKANAGADYSVARWARVGVDYVWENWHRRFREVRDSDEHRVGPAVDLLPRKWLTLRAAYTRGWRQAQGYDTHVAELGFPEGEEGNERLPQLRKFDEASRNRDEVALLATFTPRSTMSVVTSFRLANDDYPRSEYGLLDNQYLSPAVDVAYGPTRNLVLFGSYAFELYDYRQRSRERTVVVTPEGEQVVDDPSFDWTAHGEDSVHTVGGGLDLVLIPRKFTFNVAYSISQAFSRNQASGPNPNAVDYPPVRSRFQELDAIFRYDLRKGIFLRTGYRFERYDESDFATTAVVGGNDIQPFMGDVNPGLARAVFLGAYVPDYVAHIAVAGLGFEW